MAEEISGQTIYIIANLVRSIHLERTLTSVDADPPQTFWRVIYANTLYTAVIDWCKLFGSDTKEHQRAHWKHNISDPDAFLTGLWQHLNITKEDFNDYRDDIMGYRNALAAHLNLDDRPGNYPDLGIALESAYYYYGHLLRKWHALGRKGLPDNIRDYGLRFAEKATEIAEAALRATRDIEDDVF